MTTKTMPDAAKAMTMVAEDAAKASKEERRYSMATHQKSRQGDVYFMTLSEADMSNLPGSWLNTKPSELTNSLEIAKSHVLTGSFRTVRTPDGGFFVMPKKDTELALRHPEHADHVFRIPNNATLYFYVQKTMTKDSVGGRVWD